jgi:hypothetical protein
MGFQQLRLCIYHVNIFKSDYENVTNQLHLLRAVTVRMVRKLIFPNSFSWEGNWLKPIEKIVHIVGISFIWPDDLDQYSEHFRTITM